MVAEVSDPGDPSHTLKVGIVFDGGNQKSYLMQRVKDILALPVKVPIDCSSRKGKPKQCEVVHLAIHTKHGDRQVLEVFVVPHV